MTKDKDTVSSAVWEIFGDVSPIILDHYYEVMRNIGGDWQSEHGKKIGDVLIELRELTYCIRADLRDFQPSEYIKVTWMLKENKRWWLIDLV